MNFGGGKFFGLRTLVPSLLFCAPTSALESAAEPTADGSAVTVAANQDFAGDLVIARIRYLSRSSVYIDKGEADGLTEESELAVHRDGRHIAELEVVYLANHSASCRVRAADVAPAPGDEVYCRTVGPPIESEAVPQPRVPLNRSESRRPELPSRVDAPRFRGRAALEWNAFFDGDETDGDFQQPSLFLRLEGDRILGRPIGLNVHLRTEYLERSRSLGSDRPVEEWIHRIYRLSLAWNDPSLPFRLSVGRLSTNGLRGVGGWDGGLLEIRAGEGWRFGLLGGGEPAQLDGAPRFDCRKYGAYVTLEAGAALANRYRGSVGVVGQYENGALSREFAVWTNELTSGRRFGIRQDLELDVNRRWRKVAVGGNPATLARLNLLLNGQVSGSVRIHAGYDYFRNVRRLDTRDLPDSLFFDPRLQGLRVGGNWRVSTEWAFRAHVGIRGREHEDRRSLFASAAASWNDALGSRTSVQLRYAYSDGRDAESHAPALEIQRGFGSAVHLGVGLGLQIWDGFRRDSLALDGEWARFFGAWALARRVDLQWMAIHSIGDVGPGTRGQVRLAHRL